MPMPPKSGRFDYIPKDYNQQDTTKILILGSGFAGIEVLKRVQKSFRNKRNIDITLISKDNFLLLTPMLPEVASGMIETRHIVTPVREFCKKEIICRMALAQSGLFSSLLL
jgi:NADH dehydrogenase FAD-containing subunit